MAGIVSASTILFRKYKLMGSPAEGLYNLGAPTPVLQADLETLRNDTSLNTKSTRNYWITKILAEIASRNGGSAGLIRGGSSSTGPSSGSSTISSDSHTQAASHTQAINPPVTIYGCKTPSFRLMSLIGFGGYHPKNYLPNDWFKNSYACWLLEIVIWSPFIYLAYYLYKRYSR